MCGGCGNPIAQGSDVPGSVTGIEVNGLCDHPREADRIQSITGY